MEKPTNCNGDDDNGWQAFFVETRFHCFLCMDKIRKENGLVSLLTSESASFYSFQLLSHYLKMNKRTVFNEKMPVPQHLLELVDKSQLNVELCNDCAKIHHQFVSFYEKFVRVSMELTGCLQEINKKMVKADKDGLTRKFRKSAEESNSLELEKINIVERVRKEAIDKCSIKLAKVLPRVIFPRCDSIGRNSQQKQKKATAHYSTDKGNNFPETDYNSRGSVAMHISNNTEDKKGKLGKMKKKHRPGPKKSSSSNSLPPAPLNPIKLNDGSLACNVCNKVFKYVSILKNHYRNVHICSKIFSCDFCPKRFNSAANLTTHRNSIHFGIRVQCNVCYRVFPTQSHLRSHLKKKQCKGVPIRRGRGRKVRIEPPNPNAYQNNTGPWNKEDQNQKDDCNLENILAVAEPQEKIIVKAEPCFYLQTEGPEKEIIPDDVLLEEEEEQAYHVEDINKLKQQSNHIILIPPPETIRRLACVEEKERNEEEETMEIDLDPRTLLDLEHS